MAKLAREHPSKRFALFLACCAVIMTSLLGCDNGNLGLRNGSVEGVILDRDTLSGISSVSITAYSGDDTSGSSGTSGGKAMRYFTTDSNGRFYADDLRAGEWTMTFSKPLYTTVDKTATEAVEIVVVNNNHQEIGPIYLSSRYLNQYVMVKGMLKDKTTGKQIISGNTTLRVGLNTFSNIQPTNFSYGVKVPASDSQVEIEISVSGYKPMTIVRSNLLGDTDLQTIELEPDSYSIYCTWEDVPGWVRDDNPNATVIAKSGDSIVYSAVNTDIASGGFTLTGIPQGATAEISVNLKGYRMHAPITVYSTGNFSGQKHQKISLRNNLSPVMRNVRVTVSSNSWSNGNQVGTNCRETGAKWGPTTVVSTGWLNSSNGIVDLGIQSLPTAYTLTFDAFSDGGATLQTQTLSIPEDGASEYLLNFTI